MTAVTSASRNLAGAGGSRWKRERMAHGIVISSPALKVLA
jgi:hypothetical protein